MSVAIKYRDCDDGAAGELKDVPRGAYVLYEWRAESGVWEDGRGWQAWLRRAVRGRGEGGMGGGPSGLCQNSVGGVSPAQRRSG